MKIVIDGAGEIGSHLAKMLRRESNEVSVIDVSEERLSRLTGTTDVTGIVGNPSSLSTLKKAGTDHADLFIAVTPTGQQDVNVVSCLFAKALGAKKVIARIDNEEMLSAENKLILKDMGLDLPFYPEKISADEIREQLQRSIFTDTMDFAHGKLQISVFKLDEDCPLLDMTMGELSKEIAQDSDKFKILAILRNGNIIHPKADTTFQYHDMVFTIYKREGAGIIMKYLDKTSLDVQKVMILGGSKTAELTAAALSPVMKEVKLIESDKQKCVYLTEALPDNVVVVNGDGRNTDFLAEENIMNYDAFVALSSHDETNVLACVVAKKFGIERTIAEVENIEYIRLAEEMGVDVTINRKLLSASRIFRFTLSGKARAVKYMSGSDAEVLEFTAAPGAPVTKSPVGELDLPRHAIIGGVIRGSESFIADKDTKIEPYDRVAVFSLPDEVKEINRYFKEPKLL